MAAKTQFEKLMQEYINDNEWQASELAGDHAMIDFEVGEGETRTLIVTIHDDVVELDVPSAVQFEEDSAIPHVVSSLLLKRNAQFNYGAWVLEKIEDAWFYSLMYNEELAILEQRDAEEFSEIVDILMGECDEFEAIWNEYSETGNLPEPE
ncbi:MAG TPA: hypothetical protein VIO61_05520 [Anaerolineaceae bacterium]